MLDGYPFRFPVEVRFRDLDALGHVNNAVYLTYLESARIAYWLELTGRDSLQGMNMILARLEIDYRAPAAYREKLVVGARLGPIGRSSFTMELRVEEASGRLIAESRNVLVHYDYALGKSTPIPDELRRTLSGQVPPSAG